MHVTLTNAEIRYKSTNVKLFGLIYRNRSVLPFVRSRWLLCWLNEMANKKSETWTHSDNDYYGSESGLWWAKKSQRLDKEQNDVFNTNQLIMERKMPCIDIIIWLTLENGCYSVGSLGRKMFTVGFRLGANFQ